jgi:hypothetical protein
VSYGFKKIFSFCLRYGKADGTNLRRCQGLAVDGDSSVLDVLKLVHPRLSQLGFYLLTKDFFFYNATFTDLFLTF